MDRYSEFARGLCEIPNVESFSSRARILPLREFPQKCDPRRLRSYQKNQDIEQSHKDQPVFTLTTEPYKLRRIVVPPSRLQYIEPSRIPNARDPRRLRACRKFNARSKKWKYVPNWVPTLVENDEVLQEEETCAVLVIDVGEWQDRGIKHCYIEIVPHECNVQRSLAEAGRQLAELVGVREDELLMTPDEAHEAEKNMQTSARNARAQDDDSDIEECNGDGEVLLRETPVTVFDTIEDRPMLEINEEPMAGPSNQKFPRPRRTDEDEDEDRVIHEAVEPEERPMPRFDDDNIECIEIDAEQPVKQELQAPPAPWPNDADILCISLDSDEEEPVVPKKEPQEPLPSPLVPRVNDADVVCIDLDSDEEESPVVPKKEAPQEVHVHFNKYLPREVLTEVTISDSDEEDWDLVLVAMQLSKDEFENNRSKYDNNQPTSSGAASLAPIDAREDLLEKSAGLRPSESNKDYGEKVIEEGYNTSNEHYVTQKPEMPRNEAGRCVQNRDCDSDLTIGSDISDTVISASRPVDNHVDVDGETMEQIEDSVGFGAKVSETSNIADEVHRSGDSDSDMPPTMLLETVADVDKETIRDEADDVIAHSEISQMRRKTEEANIPVAADIAQKRKRIDSERFNANVNEMPVCAVIVDIKRRKENNDDAAANDENQSDNCKALVERAPSPVFKGLRRRRNKRTKRKPSKNVLQLSSTPTCAISKPSARNHHRSVVFSNFTTLGILKKYLKNYNATYTCLNFFSKSFEKLSVFEFLRVNEYVKRNNDFWRNRYSHRKEDVFIVDVTQRNQLAIEPAHPFMNSQATSICEVQPREQKTVIDGKSTMSQSEQSCSTNKGVITVSRNTWLVQGNNEEDDIEKFKSQRRHSLPILCQTNPQQRVGVKRPRSGSRDNPIIKLKLKRSQANANKWIASANMPKLPVQSTLSNSNNSAENTLEEIIPNKHVDSVTNKACVFVNKVLPKWSCIDKEVPELDIDEFGNRPLPQKMQFGKTKLSLNLQSREKRRSTSVDSAIVLDYDENSCKRMKLTDSTKEYELCMNICNYDEDGFSYNDNIGESLEITELPPDSRTELFRPQSKNVCNFNNNNEDTFKNSENQMPSNLKILPKDCSSNTVVLYQERLNQNEKNAPCLEYINQDLQDDASFASDSIFHLHVENELDDPPNTAQSQDSNIQIDHNCNLQKDMNSFDEPCNKTLNSLENETNFSEDLEKQGNFNNLYTKEVDRLNKKIETLFGESSIDEVEKMVSKKYNYKKSQTDELRHMQKDGETVNSMKTRLQPIEENQPIANTVDQSYVNSTESGLMATITTNEKLQQIFGKKDTVIDVTHEKEDHTEISMSNEKELSLESGLMTIITTNEKQQQQIFGEKDAGTHATHEKDDHIEISLSNKKDLALEITSSENQDKMITSESSTISDPQHFYSPKDVDRHEDCLDVQNSQALINNEKQIEFDNVLESESDLTKDYQNSVILNEKIDSDFSYCNINDDVTLEHPSSKEEEMVEYEKRQENGNDYSENQEISDINAPSSLSNQDQGHLEMIGFEDGLEEGDLDFHTSIHGFKTNSKYSDDDYDVDSDDEYENQATVQYLKDVSVKKPSESLVPNKNTDASDCVSNTLEKDRQSSITETERVSTICEDEHRHNSQKSPLNITNNTGPKSNWNNFDIDDEDDDIVIEYENVSNDFNHSKDVKLDISNINNDLGMQIGETSELQVSNVDITLESRPSVQKVVSPALLLESNVHDKDANVEPIQLQTKTNIETMDSSDKSTLEIPIPHAEFLPSSTLNNSSTSPSAMEVPVSSKSNNQVSSASISVNSILAKEPAIRSSANVAIDFNNRKILEKFNLTREIIAPEDIKAENSVAFENNDEDQTLSNTLENMLKGDSGKERDTSKVTDEKNNSNVIVPSSSLVFEVSLSTGLQSGSNYDLLKALNVNYINDLDVIVDKTVDKNSAKHGSPEVIKVKNLNDMLMKVSNSSPENVTSGPQAFPENSLPNVSENIQQNTNYSVAAFQEQSSLPVKMFPPPPPPRNNHIPNSYIIQPPPPYYIMSQQMPGGIQPLLNMCNALQSIPMINIGQVNFANTGLVNQLPLQNNVQIPAPAPPPASTSDKNIVLASSMFPNMFDTLATTSFASLTVISLQLPPLPNIILPPPYTILPSNDQETIIKKIQAYKFKLLEKIIETLIQLGNMHYDTIIRQSQVLLWNKPLTEETWYIQEKLLIIAQCISSFKKLSTSKKNIDIIEAVEGSMYNRVTDIKSLEKYFGIFQELKKNGTFYSHADELQPLTLELGAELKQTAIGMSSAQKEVFEYQLRIYEQIFKINQTQSNRAAQANIQTMKQHPVKRCSPRALQQNMVITTVTSPVTDIANNSFQTAAIIQRLQSVTTESLTRTTKEQHGNEKQNPSIQKAIHIEAFANQCDISKICLRCGKPSKMKCVSCLTAAYCSSDCQTIHWNVEHCTSCKPVK